MATPQFVLTTEEAKALIKMLKSSLAEIIQLPNSEQRKVEFDVVGKDKTDRFTISIYTGSLNSSKHNFGARISRSGVLLLELHINPKGAHLNPDGTKIVGSHWHIYDQEYGRKMAYPATDISSDDFVDNTLLFLDSFHVIQKPELQFQPSLS